jgi:hypothetical protein
MTYHQADAQRETASSVAEMGTGIRVSITYRGVHCFMKLILQAGIFIDPGDKDDDRSLIRRRGERLTG